MGGAWGGRVPAAEARGLPCLECYPGLQQHAVACLPPRCTAGACSIHGLLTPCLPRPPGPACAALSSFTAAASMPLASRLPVAQTQVVEVYMPWQLLTAHDGGLVQASRG